MAKCIILSKITKSGNGADKQQAKRQSETKQISKTRNGAPWKANKISQR